MASVTPECKKCVHYTKKDAKYFGTCKRFPPSKLSSGTIWAQPIVEGTDHCGEFKENK